MAAPSFVERDRLFRSFAKALFGRDMDALYEIVTPDFVWSYHDGCSSRNLCSIVRRSSLI